MIPAHILAFCDQYRDAFNQLDGDAVAQLYALPSGIAASHASTHWSTREPIAENMRQLCAIYRRDGFQSVSYAVRHYVDQGPEFALVDLAWRIERDENLAPVCFNTTYQLRKIDEEWRVLLCTAYSEAAPKKTAEN